MMTHGVAPVSLPAWYALERGGWRDYVTLLHPPYTAWHLSYVVIGGCLAPAVAWDRLPPPPLPLAPGRGGGAPAPPPVARGAPPTPSPPPGPRPPPPVPPPRGGA